MTYTKKIFFYVQPKYFAFINGLNLIIRRLFSGAAIAVYAEATKRIKFLVPLNNNRGSAIT